MHGHIQSENSLHHFLTVSRLNDMFPQNGVKRALRYVFSCLVGVSEVLANQQRHREPPSVLLSLFAFILMMFGVF